MTELLSLSVLALGVSFCATFAYLVVAKKYKIFDQQNERSMHLGSKPLGGGIGIWFAWMLIIGTTVAPYSETPTELIVVMVIGTFCVAVGFYDDIFSLSALSRIVMQAVITYLFCYFFKFPSLFGAFIGATMIISSINLANFMDGADGLLASQSALIFTVMAVIFCLEEAVVNSQIASVIAGGSIGFLLLNWSPSRIFMGDAGSYLLGFLLGVMIVDGVKLESTRIPIIILILPLFTDAFITICLRILRRERFWAAHNQHLYQRCILNGISHSRTSSLLLAASAIFAFLAMLSYFLPERALLILIIALVAAMSLWLLGNRRFRLDANF